MIPCSPSGHVLTGTYSHTEKHEYQDGLGEAVVAACRVIPDGVLLFLPSYSLLDKLLKRWKVGGCNC